MMCAHSCMISNILDCPCHAHLGMHGAVGPGNGAPGGPVGVIVEGRVPAPVPVVVGGPGMPAENYVYVPESPWLNPLHPVHPIQPTHPIHPSARGGKIDRCTRLSASNLGLQPLRIRILSPMSFGTPHPLSGFWGLKRAEVDSPAPNS